MKSDNVLKRLFESKTDIPTSPVCFREQPGSFDYDDLLSRESAKIREIQLLDRRLWKLFVDQFRLKSDDAKHTWKGEYWGKMVRGACFIYQSAPADRPDDELYAVLEETVLDLLSTQDELGRICTYTVENEFTGWDIWGRKYVMLGLLYFLDICRDEALSERITTALEAHADYMLAKLGHGDGKREIAACSENWDGLNSCSILEPFVLLFNRTREPRYLEFAEYIASFGGTMSENYFQKSLTSSDMICSYGQPKAYEMISCFEGLAELSKITGKEDEYTAVVNFADRLLSEDATVIGSLGCDSECLNHASVMQSDGDFIPSMEFEGKDIHIMQETCVTVTWMKFLWQLWRMTGDAKYMDAFEISMYNALSGSLKDELYPEENGGIILPIHSYSPLRNDVRSDIVGGQQKIKDDSLYGCCVAIAAAGFGLNTLASVGHDADSTIYLNLYRNGTVKAGATLLDITTNYPFSGEIKIKVLSADGGELALRIPEWAKKAEIVCGDKKITARPGYATVHIETGDEIALEIPMEVRVLTPDDAADVPTGRDDHICICRGPIVYAADSAEGGDILIPIDADEPIVPTDERPVPCRAALSAKRTDGGTVMLVDYRSAGQVRGHRLSAWIKIK